MTIGAGTQVYDSSYLLDCTVLFNTAYGKLCPHISFSHSHVARIRNAPGCGIFYSIPENPLGISLETFLGVKAKGFGDLEKSKNAENNHNELMEKYFTDAVLKNRFMNTHSDESTRQIIVRTSTKSIFGFTPTFVFNSLWSSSHRLREYTMSVSKKICDCCVFTVSAGVTYDDPHKGLNLESPDRRLTVACTIPLGKEVEVKGTYFHHDEDRMRSYGQVLCKPSDIPGLEVAAERYSKPGLSNPCFYVKYEGEHYDIKVEETIKNNYANDTQKASHVNQQRVFFGTNVSGKGIRKYRNRSINVLRTKPGE
jgi:hypothetical protein